MYYRCMSGAYAILCNYSILPPTGSSFPHARLPREHLKARVGKSYKLVFGIFIDVCSNDADGGKHPKEVLEDVVCVVLTKASAEYPRGIARQERPAISEHVFDI
jgi:hypothetical protein